MKTFVAFVLLLAVALALAALFVQLRHHPVDWLPTP